MGDAWEYKVVTLKPEQSGLFSTTTIPDDKEATAIINREGAQGWELVNAVSVSAAHAIRPLPLRLFFKRPR